MQICYQFATENSPATYTDAGKGKIRTKTIDKGPHNTDSQRITKTSLEPLRKTVMTTIKRLAMPRPSENHQTHQHRFSTKKKKNTTAKINKDRRGSNTKKKDKWV
jgi:hypothetical protein